MLPSAYTHIYVCHCTLFHLPGSLHTNLEFGCQRDIVMTINTNRFRLGLTH